jgi:hypothetical protein
MKKLLSLIFSLFLIFTSLSYSQTTDIKNAEKLVTDGLAFLKSSNWSSYAKLIDPADLKMLKETFDTLIVRDTTNEMATEFSGIKSKDEFLKLSGAEFFPYFMKYLVLVQEGLAEVLGRMDAKILGSVNEDNMVHVVTRQKTSLGQKEFSQLEIVTVVIKDGNQYLRMKDDLRALAEQLRGEY